MERPQRKRRAQRAPTPATPQGLNPTAPDGERVAVPNSLLELFKGLAEDQADFRERLDLLEKRFSEWTAWVQAELIRIETSRLWTGQ